MNGCLRHAAAGVLRRDAQLWWSYRGRAVSQTFTVFFSLALFYYVSRLVHVSQFETSKSYFSYVAVGILILGILTGALTAVPLAVRQELVAGTFERFVVSPLGPVAGVAAMLLFPMLSTVALSVVQFLLASAVFGLPVHWTTAAAGVPIALLGACAFAPFAIFLAAAVMVVKQVSGGAAFITSGLAFVGGLFFPVSLLPHWLHWASDVQPLTPALEALRHVLLGTATARPLAADLARLAGFAAVLGPLSLWALSRGIAAGRRRATLIEY